MTFPARRILVPDDFTPASDCAWEWARRMAVEGAPLESLFVWEMPPAPLMGLPAPALSPRVRKQLQERMRAQRPEAKLWTVEAGDAVSGILRRARRSDLVVMCSHARTGLARAAFGSVTEAVIRESPVPVLAARGGSGRVKTVLAPVNARPYSYKGMLLAAETAVHLGAELVLLHVSPPGVREGNPRFAVNGLLERLPKALRDASRPRLLLRGGEPIPVILAESRRHGLVVLTAHRKSLLGDLVVGTTVERVLRHSPVPVLSAPSG
ncbi:MAG TPA: universal stress protein [Elusimicrobiota bacterium]|nr:universal stress protein [Elusimicrobiota bacterium]